MRSDRCWLYNCYINACLPKRLTVRERAAREEPMLVFSHLNKKSWDRKLPRILRVCKRRREQLTVRKAQSEQLSPICITSALLFLTQHIIKRGWSVLTVNCLRDLASFLGLIISTSSESRVLNSCLFRCQLPDDDTSFFGCQNACALSHSLSLCAWRVAVSESAASRFISHHG